MIDISKKGSLTFSCLEGCHLGFLTKFVGENYTKFKGFLVSVSYPNICLRVENYSRIKLIVLDC